MDKLFKQELSEFVSDSKELIKEIKTVISSKKDYSLKDLDFIENQLEKRAYEASFLSVPEISEFLHPVSEYIKQLKLSGNVTKNSFNFVFSILSRFSEYIDQIDIPDNDGLYIDSSEVILSSHFKKLPGCSDLIHAYEKRQIDCSKINRFKKLSFRKDKDFSWSINLPSNYISENKGKYYISLVYLDVYRQKNRDTLIESLKNLDRRNYTIIHGALQVPLKNAVDSETVLPYYILLKTTKKADKFLREHNIDGKVIRILHRPEDYTEPPSAVIQKIITPEIISEKHEEPLLSAEAEQEELPASAIDKKGYKNAIKKGEIRFSIGFKMISIISLIIIMTLSGMIFLATYFFLQDSRVRVEENNLKVSEVISMKIEEDLNSFSNAASLLMLGANQEGEGKEDFVRYFFRNQSNVLFTGLPSAEVNFYNKDIMLEYNIDENFIDNIITENSSEINQAMQGITSVINVSPYFGVPVMCLSIPYRQGRSVLPMVMLIDLRSSFMELIDTRGITLTYIVNEKGDLIAHPEEEMVIDAVNFSELEVVKDMFDQPVSSGQIRYVKESGETNLGSYKKIPTGRLGIITEVNESVAFEAIYIIQRRNIYLMVMVLSLAVLIVYFFSKSMTIPVRNLVVATKMIETGQFNIDLKAKSKDEIGVLTRAFVDMGKGLEEKERMKDAFGRFVNQEIAEMAMKNEIQLGGEIKQATIFFSDIRSFTAISEKLTPSEVVEFLNDYMTLMVECVNESHGFVDKYIGDAIMAVWGTPISHGNDAENAINGALKMRTALMRFNLDRGSDKKPIIRIGCGLNTGDVLAGQIGSTERMEYTVIGDAVNLASRIEALNKPMGTDLLISQNTAEVVEGIYDLVPMNKIKVKGKSEPQQIYAVLGRLDDENRPKSLKELRQKVGIIGDFDNIADVEEKEVKYEIID